MDIVSDPAVTVLDLQAHLTEYLNRAQAGETIVVMVDGKPVARLLPPEPRGEKIPRSALYGSMKGQIWMAPDFDDEDPDMIASVEPSLFP